mgnify:CR=1 FL=1
MIELLKYGCHGDSWKEEISMFICNICEQKSQPREKPIHIITERRERTYINKSGKISFGWEIVKQVFIHRDCPNSICFICGYDLYEHSITCLRFTNPLVP